ncbi:beta-2-microglobulin-like [Cynoglossus semilaevis]|nr:beta-2-microglobulin-like [Cynoglossus semilaevis]
MKLFLCLTALAALYCAVESRYSPPKVQVYSTKPGLFGDDNILLCHVSDFHPPDITIQLMRNAAELTPANQTDLAFKQNWHFHLTRSVKFKPQEGEEYRCVVKHGSDSAKSYLWDPNV